LTASADQWRRIFGLDDEAAAKLIAEDGIDVLVDLSGHTANNRLSLFARQPARVQATWLGYPGSTGVEAIKYRLVDAITDPPGEADAHYSERLIRLDRGFLCYAPLDEAPDPVMRPEGPVRFGSFNNPAKLSPATLELWVKVLEEVDGSELVLKGRSFADPQMRQTLLNRFGKRGIALDRIVLLEHMADPERHMAAYSEVDIGLDPFPYNGTTTTCEALWMGVPVVTMLGTRHSARVGASLLTRVGLDSLIARDEQDYVRLAADLARDYRRRAGLRGKLRAMMRNSPLCDGPGFTRCLEEAYRGMAANLAELT